MMTACKTEAIFLSPRCAWHSDATWSSLRRSPLRGDSHQSLQVPGGARLHSQAEEQASTWGHNCAPELLCHRHSWAPDPVAEGRPGDLWRNWIQHEGKGSHRDVIKIFVTCMKNRASVMISACQAACSKTVDISFFLDSVTARTF